MRNTELILGGQKSGKSARAELLARDWLAQSAAHRAVLVATGQAWDAEMAQRIARHRLDRARRVPGLQTVEEPLHLAQVLKQWSQPDTLVLIDCLTLWLTQCVMPAVQAPAHADATAVFDAQAHALVAALPQCLGPVVLVSNEIGWGVIPMGAEVRQFVDRLGRLNQDVASVCQRVTLMAAGLPLMLKDCPDEA